MRVQSSPQQCMTVTAFNSSCNVEEHLCTSKAHAVPPLLLFLLLNYILSDVALMTILHMTCPAVTL